MGNVKYATKNQKHVFSFNSLSPELINTVSEQSMHFSTLKEFVV